MTASADRPSGMASIAIPSSVAIPSVLNPPLSTDWPGTLLAAGTLLVMACGVMAFANGAEAERRAKRPSMLNCMLLSVMEEEVGIGTTRSRG